MFKKWANYGNNSTHFQTVSLGSNSTCWVLFPPHIWPITGVNVGFVGFGNRNLWGEGGSEARQAASRPLTLLCLHGVASRWTRLPILDLTWFIHVFFWMRNIVKLVYINWHEDARSRFHFIPLQILKRPESELHPYSLEVVKKLHNLQLQKSDLT